MQPCLRTIVCPVGPGEIPAAVLCYAGFIARCSGARLSLLRLASDHVPATVTGEVPRSVRRLEKVELGVFPQLEDVNVEQFELTGEAAIGIHDFVLEHKADTVILTNDLGATGEVTLSDLSRRVVEILPCTTVIVKDPKRPIKFVAASD